MSLTPQRLYHPHSSLLASQIHQRNMKYENSPRCSQFLQAYSPAFATCEEQSQAELWEYEISCHWCLVNQHPIPRKGRLCSHVPATCRNVAEPPSREGGHTSRELVTAHTSDLGDSGGGRKKDEERMINIGMRLPGLSIQNDKDKRQGGQSCCLAEAQLPWWKGIHPLKSTGSM